MIRKFGYLKILSVNVRQQDCRGPVQGVAAENQQNRSGAGRTGFPGMLAVITNKSNIRRILNSNFVAVCNPQKI